TERTVKGMTRIDLKYKIARLSKQVRILECEANLLITHDSKIIRIQIACAVEWDKVFECSYVIFFVEFGDNVVRIDPDLKPVNPVSFSSLVRDGDMQGVTVKHGGYDCVISHSLLLEAPYNFQFIRLSLSDTVVQDGHCNAE